jgi:phosphoglycerate dehydrogenase-like enzyme
VTAVVAYLSYPAVPDLDRLRVALGPDAQRVELVAGPLFQDDAAARTRKRAGEQGDGDPEAALTDAHLEAYRRAEVLLALDVPHRLVDLAPELAWVQACGAGVGQFGEDRLAARGIALTTAAGVGAPPIAEFVIARVLEELKGLRRLGDLQRERRWEFSPGNVLAGRRMLIVGVGAIGGAVARLARAFGVHTVGIRRNWTTGETPEVVDEPLGPDSLDDQLARADIVVLAAPESAETRGLLDARRLRLLDADAIVCNVARGSLIVEADLLEVVRAGHLRAAILDVVAEEPLPPDSPLWGEARIVLSPHSSTSTDGYDDRLLDLFADNLRRYLDGSALVNVVDLGSAAP